MFFVKCFFRIRISCVIKCLLFRYIMVLGVGMFRVGSYEGINYKNFNILNMYLVDIFV